MNPRLINGLRYLAILLILLSAGCVKEKEESKAIPTSQEPALSPEDVFFEYSRSIDAGDYERAFNLTVVEAGGSFRAMEEHEKLAKKLSLTETYGEKGEKFEILELEVINKEQLEDRVRLRYRMKYSLNGKQDEIREYIDLVLINGTWKVVFP
jgi:hypothetical protein